jgi:hypothetical protein
MKSAGVTGSISARSRGQRVAVDACESARSHHSVSRRGDVKRPRQHARLPDSSARQRVVHCRLGGTEPVREYRQP